MNNKYLDILKKHTNFDNSSKSEELQILSIKSPFEYKIRFLPYFNSNNELIRVYKVTSHYISGKNIKCKGANCPYCKSGNKSRTYQYSLVRLEHTTDKFKFEKSLYLFLLPKTLIEPMKEYEITNNNSVYNINNSPLFVIKIVEKTGYDNRKFNSYENSYAESIETTLNPELDNMSEEEFISYVKSITTNPEMKILSMFQEEISSIKPAYNKTYTKSINQKDTKEDVKPIQKVEKKEELQTKELDIENIITDNLYKNKKVIQEKEEQKNKVTESKPIKEIDNTKLQETLKSNTSNVIDEDVVGDDEVENYIDNILNENGEE